MTEPNPPKIEKKEWMLALETSGEVCGIALFRGDTFVAEHAFRHEMRLSERLIEFTDRLLADAKVAISDMDAFAVGTGPGSFTGVRIGVMTAKTWAYTLNKPLFGINALEAIASDYAGLRGTLVLPMLPCRIGMVYAAAYLIGEDGGMTQVAEPAMQTFAEAGNVVQLISAPQTILCGPGAARHQAELTGLFADLGRRVDFGQDEFARASQAARLARRRWLTDNLSEDALSLVPLYITPPQITLPKIAFAVAPEIHGMEK